MEWDKRHKDMNYKVADLSNKELQQIEELEASLGKVLIAYDPSGNGAPTRENVGTTDATDVQ